MGDCVAPLLPPPLPLGKRNSKTQPSPLPPLPISTILDLYLSLLFPFSSSSRSQSHVDVSPFPLPISITIPSYPDLSIYPSILNAHPIYYPIYPIYPIPIPTSNPLPSPTSFLFPIPSLPSICRVIVSHTLSNCHTHIHISTTKLIRLSLDNIDVNKLITK